MRQLLRVVFGLNVIFLMLLAISFPALKPGTGSYVVAMLSGVVITGTLLLTGGLLFVGWTGFERSNVTD